MNSRRRSSFLFDDPDDGALPQARRGDSIVAPAPFDDEIRRLGHRLPGNVYLGTSSWSFPGWQGIVYGGAFTEPQLARRGLAAYSAHPLLRSVCIDRSYYQPLAGDDYAHYADQVPPGFRFVVKAPAFMTDAAIRGERGTPDRDNPQFLDAALAAEQFAAPAMEGLRDRVGPLVFQLAPMPRAQLRTVAEQHALIARIGEFIARLPQRVAERAPIYAVELRNSELLTPRFVRTLREAGARLCLSIHSRMPAAARQSAALRAMDAPDQEGEDWRLQGPLVVRWNLHAGLLYDEAKNRYAPFDRLIDADIVTRGTLAHLVHVAIKSAQPAFVIANNKAEGSAPLSCIELAKAVLAR